MSKENATLTKRYTEADLRAAYEAGGEAAQALALAWLQRARRDAAASAQELPEASPAEREAAYFEIFESSVRRLLIAFDMPAPPAAELLGGPPQPRLERLRRRGRPRKGGE